MIIELRRLAIVLLSVSIALIICGLATSHWGCGSLFETCQRSDYKVAVIAVIALLLVGITCLGIVFILDLVSLCSTDIHTHSGYVTTRFIFLYIGAVALVVAVLVFTGTVGHAWSYFVTTVGCVLATQVAILAAVSSRCVAVQHHHRRVRA
ncbi:hypothetical protein CRM22_007722 [Opisthorchis felineus]|uniref:MARVEL domain-containing protein n=1 Tax=Opisthorchis felineus TaxID=147828 RepID=A0A4S2LFC1_OPIFE|nr:hypothetical protein CRM22_007722 [Opisthorchis felineus]